MGFFGEDEIEQAERLKNERREKLLQLQESSKKKLLDLEQHFTKKCEKEREEMVSTKKKEIKDIRDETEEQLRNIELLITAENAGLLSQQEAIMKQADEAMEQAAKKLKDTISEAIHDWDVQNTEMSEKFKESEAKLEKVYERNQIEQIFGVSSIENFRSEMAEKQEKEDAKRFEEVLKLTSENLETQLELSKTVAQKFREDAESIEKRQKKIIKTKEKSMKKINKIKRAEINRDSLNALHQSVTDLKLMKNGIQELIDECVCYLEKDFSWIEDTKENAKKTFGDLRTRLRSLSFHFISMQQMISDIEDIEERNRREKEIEKVNAYVSESGSSIAPFVSQLMSGKTAWDEDRVTKFNDLMNKITSGIDCIKLPAVGDLQLYALLD